MASTVFLIPGTTPVMVRPSTMPFYHQVKTFMNAGVVPGGRVGNRRSDILEGLGAVSLATGWQNIDFYGRGATVSHNGHRISHQKRTLESGAKEERYPVTGPLVNSTFPTYLAATTAIDAAVTAKKKTEQAAKEEAAKVVASASAPVQKPISASVQVPVQPVKRVAKKPAPVKTMLGPDAPPPNMPTGSHQVAQGPLVAPEQITSVTSAAARAPVDQVPSSNSGSWWKWAALIGAGYLVLQ